MLRKKFQNFLTQKINFNQSDEVPRWNLLTYRGFKNNQIINEFLINTTKFNKEILQNFKNNFKDQKIHVFQLNRLYKIFFCWTRIQCLFYCIIYGGIECYDAYSKYQLLLPKKTKKAKAIRDQLLFSGLSLVLLAIVSSIFTVALGKRFVKSIYYLPQTNQLQLNYFSLILRDRPILIDIKNLNKLDPKEQWTVALEYSYKDKNQKINYFYSKGTGKWANIYLIDSLHQESLDQTHQNI